MNCDCGAKHCKDSGHAYWCKTNQLDMPINVSSRFEDFKASVKARPLAMMGYVTDDYGKILDPEFLNPATQHLYRNTYISGSQLFIDYMKQSVFSEVWIEKSAKGWQDVYDLCTKILPRSSTVRLIT